jgi:hypothetical protein
MRRKILITSLIAAILLILGLPIAAGAQSYNRYYGDRNQDRSDRFDRGDRDLRDAIQRLDNSSARLQSDLNSMRTRRMFGFFWGPRDNSAIWAARDFRTAVRNLRNSSNNGRDLNRSYDEARLVIDRGAELHRVIQQSNNSRLEADWFEVRRDLQRIADAYGLRMPY